MNNALNLADYAMSAAENEVFHGGSSEAELGQLSKALEGGLITGRDTTNSTTASGSPLKVESLEKTLKVVTFQEQQIASWKLFPKDKAFNTVEEFNQVTSYGSEENSAFLIEGELPGEEDSTYVRRAQLVKFMGVTRSVSHVMTLVNTNVGNIIDQYSREGTLSILQRLDRSLFYADSRLDAQAFNGLYAQHESHDGTNYVNGSLASYLDSTDLVIDMRGSILTTDAVERAMEAISENYGIGTHLFGPNKVFSNYALPLQKFQRYNLNADNNGVMPGNNIPGQVTNFGNVDFTRDVFLRRPRTVEVGVNSGATSAKAPLSVTPGGTPLTLVNPDAAGKWNTADAGSYTWGVRAVNRFGKSALVVLTNTPLTMVAVRAADLSFTASGSGEPATYFEIYRSQNGSITKFDFAFNVNVAQLAAGYDGGAAGVVRDRNRFIPGTDQAMLIENKQGVMTYKQLAPLMKMDLAVVSPAYRFMILQYGTVMLFAPRKAVRFINIGEIVPA